MSGRGWADEPVVKWGVTMPVRVDDDGRMICPDLGCEARLVEVEPGLWECPVSRVATDAIAAVARRLYAAAIDAADTQA